MKLSREAAYLYKYARALEKLNKQLHKRGKVVEHIAKKKGKAKTTKEQEHHHKKHRQTVDSIKDLLKEHNKLLERLRSHQQKFIDALRKEHKV